MWFRRVAIVLAVGTWIACCTAPAWAQGRRGPRAPGAPQPRLPELQVVGDIEAVAPGRILVKSGADQRWMLEVSPEARVEVKGKAKPEALAIGQCISFVATVDMKTGKVDEKIGKATLFTPDGHRPLGALPEGFAGAFDQAEGKKDGKKEKKKEGKAEVGAFSNPFGAATGGAGGFGAAGGSGGRKSKSGAGAAKAALGPQSLEVRGQITGVQNGKLALRMPPNMYCNRSSLMVEMAPDAEIDIDLSGAQALLMARKGDKIQVHGQQMGMNMGRLTQADVTLVEVLDGGDSKKKAMPRFERGARGKRDSDEPAEDDAKPQKGKKAGKKGKADSEDAPADKDETKEKKDE